jgi:hypothetical protein
MVFYKCDACVVITGSMFTLSARDLANATGCLLVDEVLMPRFILGTWDIVRDGFGITSDDSFDGIA